MKVNIQYPNPEYNFDFTIRAAFHNGKETMLLGYNHDPRHDKTEILGFVENENKDDKSYFYATKYINKTYFTMLEKAKIGKEVLIYSDISSGFWMPENYKKIELNQIEPIITGYNKYKLISKTPSGFMISK